VVVETEQTTIPEIYRSAIDLSTCSLIIFFPAYQFLLMQSDVTKSGVKVAGLIDLMMKAELHIYSYAK